MMKTFRIYCMVTAVLLSLMACTNDQNPNQAVTEVNSKAMASADEQQKIRFMGWGTDKEIMAYQKMIEQFQEAYPHVSVEYIVMADNEFDTKLQTMIGAQDAPDVFYCNIDKMMKYAATGNLYNLTEYVNHNEIYDKENIWACLNDLYKYDGNTQGQGDVYAFPKDVSVFPIVYNKDMFAEAGIVAPTADKPWDWNDYLEAAKLLTKGEGDNKVYGSGAYSLESAVWSNGGEWIDQDTLSKIHVSDPAFVEAFQFCADLSLVHGVAPGITESQALSDYDRFKQGKVAMIGAGTWSIADLWENCTFEWDVMNWPVSPNTGKSEIWFGSAGLAVSAKTKYPEAACNLAAYLAFNEEAQRTAYEMGQAVPMLKDMAYGEYSEFEKKPESKQVLFDILEKSARLASQSRTFNQEWFTEFNANTASVFSGEMTAEEFCKTIEPDLQRLLDESIVQKKEYAN